MISSTSRNLARAKFVTHSLCCIYKFSGPKINKKYQGKLCTSVFENTIAEVIPFHRVSVTRSLVTLKHEALIRHCAKLLPNIPKWRQGKIRGLMIYKVYIYFNKSCRNLLEHSVPIATSKQFFMWSNNYCHIETVDYHGAVASTLSEFNLYNCHMTLFTFR